MKIFRLILILISLTISTYSFALDKIPDDLDLHDPNIICYDPNNEEDTPAYQDGYDKGVEDGKAQASEDCEDSED